MTLKETFNQWSVAPGNSVLANRSRDAVNKVLLKEYGDTDLELIDKTFARNIFAGSDVAQELKTKAASILVYVLQWGGDHGYCRRPSFDYTIAREVKPADKPKGRKKPQEVIKPQEDTEEKKDTDNLLNTDYKDYKETAAEQPQANSSVKSIKSVLNKKSAAKPKRIIRKVDDDICQLDPKTLEVVKKWPHALRIKQELGIHNVARAIERCGQAGGFYWSYSRELDTFAKRLAARQEHNAQVHADHCAQMRASKTPTQRDRDTEEKIDTDNLLNTDYKDYKETAAEQPQANPSVKSIKSVLNKKSMSDKNVCGTQESPCPSVQSVAKKPSVAEQALAVFTDDELFAELDRRGWFGYFSRTEIVTIGNK